MQTTADRASSPYQAPATELLTLENGSLRMQLWPRMGGKIVSLVARTHTGDQELLHRPIHAYNEATDVSGFEYSDAGGWDECIPSVAACDWNGAAIPDHGDVWRKPWTLSMKHEALFGHVEASSVPLRCSRHISLDGPTMQLQYTIVNMGSDPADFLWSAHPLFAVEAGDRIVLQGDVNHVRVEGSSEAALRPGEDCSWPLVRTTAGELDLSTVGPRDGVTSHKLFAGPLNDGWCGLYRTRLKLGIVMHFDAARTPFAGLWISQGAWPPGSGDAKQYTVALEPTTAAGDSLENAARRGQAKHLQPKAEFSWPLQVQVAGIHQAVEYDEFVQWASAQPA